MSDQPSNLTSPVPFVDLNALPDELVGEIRRAIDSVIERSDFILGGEVDAFEAEFAAYCGVAHAVGVDSGTSALELALRALGVGAGDEVIVPANTFIATALAITHAGGRPVLVDIDPETQNIDPEGIESSITLRTRAIVPVHLYGVPAAMDRIMEVASRHGLAVLEDASQAHGARHRGRRVGSIGQVAAFSLYPAKNLGALGDAGVVVTDDPAVAERVRLLRNYGSAQKYHHQMPGFNRRLDTLQAAVLRAKLGYLDGWNEARRERASLYTELLAEWSGMVDLPRPPEGTEPVWHLYVVRCDDREGLRRHLAAEGIATGIHYPVPIHLQPAYADLGYRQGDFPFTERDAQRILSLPMYPQLPLEQLERVAASIGAFLAGRTRRMAS